MSIIVDRRLNDRNKSATNRERFIRRYKEQVARAVADAVSARSIKDMERGTDVRIPVKDISEPSFRHGHGGDRETVHPGNRKFHPGDRIERPQSGADGRGEGDGHGDGNDDFAFALSREEFMQLFFDDLELPHLERNVLGGIAERRLQRAGYTRQGASTNLAVLRSLRNALGRRIALAAPLKRQLARKQAERVALAAADDGDKIEASLREIAELQRRIARVPYLEEIDLRYRHRVAVPQPMSQAVMFCLMDVSASMDQGKKDLAKRFFTLLYLFLTRKYRKVDLVFVRHTENADEVDEQTFFYDTQSGGTVVFSALALMHEIVTARYAPASWNIYGAQVSDGDAFGADPERSRGFLETELLPLARYYAYIEVPDSGSRVSTLAASYRRIAASHFAMREVHERRDIYPVLRELFRKEAQ